MTTNIRGYRRVAGKYNWDYKNAELKLAENLEQLSRQSRVCNRLATELENLLDSDTRFGDHGIIDPYMAQSVLELAGMMEEKLTAQRRLYHQQVAQVAKLRKDLLLARTRRNKSRDKHKSAVLDFHRQLEARELGEIADRFAGRLQKQNSVSEAR